MEGLQRVRTLLQDEVELFTAAGASLPPFCLSPFLPLPTSAVVKIASLPLILFSLLCHWAFFFVSSGNALSLCEFLVSVRNIREFEFVVERLYEEGHFEQLLRRVSSAM